MASSPAVVLTLIVLVIGAAWCGLRIMFDAKKERAAWITINDISELASQMRKGEKEDAAWIQFYIPLSSSYYSSARPLGSDEHFNIQYSMWGGKFGLDWLGGVSPNDEREADVIALAKRAGFSVEKISDEAGDEYVRIEGDRVDELAKRIAQDLFGVDEQTKFRFDAEGFEWSLKQG